MYDIAVIGAGPGGYTAAVRAAQLGAKVVLIEEHKLGGVCLNYGCIPTKVMLHSAALINELQQAPELGIKISPPQVDFPTLITRQRQVVARQTKGVQWLLDSNKVEVIKGSAELLSSHELKVNDTIIQTKNIIIAVGSRPIIPELPGAAGAEVISSDQALNLEKLPQSLVIIGAGAVGIEMAYLFQSLGCPTSLIELLDRVAPTMDPELSKGLHDLLQKLGVKIFTGARVAGFGQGEVRLVRQEQAITLKTEKILLAVGRRSNGDRLALDQIGIKHQRGVISSDEYLRTNLTNIYAIGDVNGRYQLAHVASSEAIIAVENIMGMKRIMDYSAVPQCIYTVPEAAMVGLTEAEAVEEGLPVQTGRAQLLANGKAMAEGFSRGFVKLVVESASKRLLGAQLLAPHATELIAYLAGAITTKQNVDQLQQTIFPHPTVSELIGEAVQSLKDSQTV